jgi:hypothetical protein
MIGAQTDASDPTCPGDFTLVDEYCYRKSTEQATWDEANTACEDSDGWLVVLQSREENYGLLEWLENNGMVFASFFSGPYIGMRRFNTSTTDFTYVICDNIVVYF